MIKSYLKSNLNETQLEFIGYYTEDGQSMLSQLETSLIKGPATLNLSNFTDNPKLVRDFTYGMSKLGLGVCVIRPKFAQFAFNIGLLDDKELHQFRLGSKVDKALLRLDEEEYDQTLTKIGKDMLDVGHHKPGFAKVAKNTFKLDINTLIKYQRPIRQNLVKSISNAIENGKIKDIFFEDKANYHKLVNEVLLRYILEPDTSYNLERNLGENRGRASFKALKRIGNPIQHKDFRSLLVVPENRAIQMNLNSTKELEDIWYFIAEVTGNKCLGGTYKDKVQAGNTAYTNRILPRLDLTSEHGRKELHELMILERVYAKLDTLYKTGSVLWDIPLEVDATMSLAQITGAVLNEKRLLESTNVIGKTLSDAWSISGVRRKAGKLYGTPTFYGSSASARSLIASKKYLFTQLNTDDQVNKDRDKAELQNIQREFSRGKFSVIKQFKDCMISNYNVHTPVIDIELWNKKFQVHVNKWKISGYTKALVEAYDSQSGKYKRTYVHTPQYVPDYKHMKLYFQTLFIHGLDGIVMDNIANKYDDWMITIHDAILALPGSLKKLRAAYASELKEINRNRKSIVWNYRKSIGATTPKADVMFMKLHKSIIDAGEVEFQHTAMK